MLSLARKYRPKSFADVAVQTHVSNALRGAIARGRVAHGYLLCGPRGTGKTTLARVLAMALNCEQRGDSGEPCVSSPRALVPAHRATEKVWRKSSGSMASRSASGRAPGAAAR